jgi:predicted MFS family arabinose efflux permease
MTGVRLGFTVGPMIGSYLYRSYLPTTPFLAATVLSIMGAAFALFFKEKNK